MVASNNVVVNVLVEPDSGEVRCFSHRGMDGKVRIACIFLRPMGEGRARRLEDKLRGCDWSQIDDVVNRVAGDLMR